MRVATRSGGDDTTTAVRTTREVFEDHLRLRAEGDLESDIARNFSDDLVLLHVDGVERGHAGARKSGTRLKDQLPDSEFEYRARHVEGPYAYLEWSATSRRARVRDGADSFVIRDGWIVMQSIHYTLEEPGEP